MSFPKFRNFQNRKTADYEKTKVIFRLSAQKTSRNTKKIKNKKKTRQKIRCPVNRTQALQSSVCRQEGVNWATAPGIKGGGHTECDCT